MNGPLPPPRRHPARPRLCHPGSASLLLAGVCLSAASALLTSGCQGGFVEFGKPLGIQVTVDRAESSVGQELTFQVEATGTQLDQVSIQFGDGEGESLSAMGADTATMQVTHAYLQAGTFQVTATALQITGESVSHRIEVRILDPP